ncbi:MAG: Wzz/FepE/Etk N-terminal domain-containing protein, partial [Burkholderiales bacterium]
MTLMQFLSLLRARLKLIVGVVVAVVGVVAIVSLIMPKQYIASASVVVGPGGTAASLDGRSAVSQTVDSIVATQEDIIGSRRVAEKVVDNLGLEHNANAWQLIGGDSINPLGKVKSWISSLLPQDDNGAGGPSTLRDQLADALSRNLHLTSQLNSRVININYTSQDPQFAAKAANAFADQYMGAVLNLNVQPAKANSRWLNDQTKQLKANLERAQQNLAAFERKTGIVGVGDKLDLENARLTQLTTQLVAAQAQGYSSDSQQKQLKTFLKKGGSVPTDVQANSMVQQLRLRITQQQATLTDLSHQVGRRHPKYRAAETELRQLRGELSTTQRTVAKGLLENTGMSAQQVTALKNAIAQEKAKVLELTGDHNQAALLQQDVDNARQTYSNALQQASQAHMASQMDRTDISMIAPAVMPRSPAKPRVGFNIAVAFVLGMVIAIGLALWAELNNRFVRSPDDILEFIGVPVLGVLGTVR